MADAIQRRPGLPRNRHDRMRITLACRRLELETTATAGQIRQAFRPLWQAELDRLRRTGTKGRNGLRALLNAYRVLMAFRMGRPLPHGIWHSKFSGGLRRRPAMNAGKILLAGARGAYWDPSWLRVVRVKDT